MLLSRQCPPPQTCQYDIHYIEIYSQTRLLQYMFPPNFTVNNTSVTTICVFYILHAFNLYFNLLPPNRTGQNSLKAQVRTLISFDDSTNNRAWFSREINDQEYFEVYQILSLLKSLQGLYKKRVYLSLIKSGK